MSATADRRAALRSHAEAVFARAALRSTERRHAPAPPQTTFLVRRDESDTYGPFPTRQLADYVALRVVEKHRASTITVEPTVGPAVLHLVHVGDAQLLSDGVRVYELEHRQVGNDVTSTLGADALAGARLDVVTAELIGLHTWTPASLGEEESQRTARVERRSRFGRR